MSLLTVPRTTGIHGRKWSQYESSELSVRYAILSDIHSNLPALEAVQDRLASEGIDRVICLGDTVGYGAFPNECCDTVRSLDPVIVRGNHDYAAIEPGAERWFTPAASKCVLWTREQLTEENRQYLLGLEPFAAVEGAHICHGALFDSDYYTTTPREAAGSFRVMTEPLCFFGHTHYAEWFTESAPEGMPVQHPMADGGTLETIPGRRYMINPGAVGQPRDGNSQAAYAVWDTELRTVSLQRVAYNIKAAQEKMEMAELPWNMAARLTMGV